MSGVRLLSLASFTVVLMEEGEGNNEKDWFPLHDSTGLFLQKKPAG